MDTIESITAANKALARYLVHAEGVLDGDVYAKVEEFAYSPSPVDAIVKTAEYLYARRDMLDEQGRTIVAQLASFAAVNSWHDLAKDNRGGRIAQAMLRDNGEQPEAGQPAYPEAESDPAPDIRFAPAPVPVAPVEPQP